MILAFTYPAIFDASACVAHLQRAAGCARTAYGLDNDLRRLRTSATASIKRTIASTKHGLLKPNIFICASLIHPVSKVSKTLFRSFNSDRFHRNRSSGYHKYVSVETDNLFLTLSHSLPNAKPFLVHIKNWSFCPSI